MKRGIGNEKVSNSTLRITRRYGVQVGEEQPRHYTLGGKVTKCLGVWSENWARDEDISGSFIQITGINNEKQSRQYSGHRSLELTSLENHQDERKKIAALCMYMHRCRKNGNETVERSRGCNVCYFITALVRPCNETENCIFHALMTIVNDYRVLSQLRSSVSFIFSRTSIVLYLKENNSRKDVNNFL